MHSPIKLPTPAMAVAFTALLAALGGTAVALPGKSTVDSGDIRNSAIRTQDLRNNDVRGGDIRNGTVRGVDVGNGSLAGSDLADRSVTGQDIDEATLGTVPSASRATTAQTAGSAQTATSAGSVAGQALRKFNLEILDDGPMETLTVSGLRLEANCPVGQALLDAKNVTGIDGAIAVQGNDASLGNYRVSDGEFNEIDIIDLSPAGGTSGAGTASVVFGNGTVVTVVFAYRDDGLGTGLACRFYGHITAG